jgi:histone H3/H4
MSDDMYKIDSDCVAEFINLISSESNEICSKEEKRTIAPEHVLRALEVFFLK